MRRILVAGIGNTWLRSEESSLGTDRDRVWHGAAGLKLFANETLLSHGLQVHSQMLTDPDMPLPAHPEEDQVDEEESRRRLSSDQLKQHLESLRPEDFGKFNL